MNADWKDARGCVSYPAGTQNQQLIMLVTLVFLLGFLRYFAIKLTFIRVYPPNPRSSASHFFLVELQSGEPKATAPATC